MNPLQIHYFLQVAQYRSITLASSEMHVSQPAVSKQILSLERELEVDLFDRSGKRLTLTKSGELYYHFFVHTNTEFEDLKRLAKEVNRQPQQDKLKIRMIFFIDWDSELFMVPLTKRLEERYPLLEIELENRGFTDIAQALTDTKCDLTVCFDDLVPDRCKPRLNMRHLADVHRMAFFSVHHPLLMRENLQFADFRQEFCFVLSGKQMEAERATIQTICNQYGFEPRFRFKPNHDSVIMATQVGHGYCILDEWSRNRNNTSFRTLPLEVTRPVSVCWRRDNPNPVIPTAVRTLRELFGQSVEEPNEAQKDN